MNTIHIEIGCCPGSPRPIDYLTNMLKTLQKSENPFIVEWAKNYETNPPDCSTIFGDMSCFLNVTPNIENDVKNFFENHLKNLYYSGAIRYASW